MTTAWKELGFRSYDAYIKSRLWWNIRQLVLERDGKCCQVCGKPSKIVHHIDYTKIVMLGQGDQHELITLCDPCHNFVEQSKRLTEKRKFLNQLFIQNSKNTLDEWQIWAKKYNTDIGYSYSRILEPKNNNSTKRNIHHKKKKNKNKKKTNSKSQTPSLRDNIDYFIKQHKDAKNNSNNFDRKEYTLNNIHKYNRKSEKNINKFLEKHHFCLDMEYMYEHPQISNKLKKCLKPYFFRYLQELRNKETVLQRKRRLEQEEIKEILDELEKTKQKNKKKIKSFGKLPAWKMNHKAKSFQGASTLFNYVKQVKNKQP